VYACCAVSSGAVSGARGTGGHQSQHVGQHVPDVRALLNITQQGRYEAAM